MTIIFSLFLLLVVFSASFISGWGLLQYFQQQQLFNPIVIRVLSILAIGLMSGLLTRLFFRKWSLFMKLAISLLATGLALVLLDKVNPKNYELVFIDRQPWSQPIWIDILQIGLGFVMSVLALFIGKRTRRMQPESRRVRAARAAKLTTRSKPRKSFQIFKLRKKEPKKKIFKKKNVKKNEQKRIRTRRSLGGYQISNLTVSKPRHIRQRDVKLLGETEHRCPYCLELVNKHDARGVVICPECKTWHHKDCWDVTGSCQVAHRHDL